MKNLSKLFWQLGIAVMLLSLKLSLMGLFLEGLYQDTNDFILQGWWINDWVTLILGIPLFLVALYLGKHGSIRGYCLLLGMMMYTVYNYSYYLFGAAFNLAFLGYVFVFVFGVFGLLTGAILLVQLLRREDLPSIRFSRVISIYMILTAVFLSIGWIGQWLNFVLTGIKPPLLQQLGASNHLVAALDMTVVVPLFLLGAVLFWKQSVLGLIVSVMVHVKTVIYNVILIWGSIFQHQARVEGAADLMPLWLFFLVGSAASSVVLIQSVKKRRI